MMMGSHTTISACFATSACRPGFGFNIINMHILFRDDTMDFREAAVHNHQHMRPRPLVLET